MKKITKLITSILIIAMSICIFAACTQTEEQKTESEEQKVEAVAKNLLDAWAAGDGNKAASLCTEIDIDGNDNLKERANEVADIAKNMVYEITKVTVTGNNAVVKVDITDQGKTWEDKTLYLTKENDTWKINGYSI